MSGGGSVAVAWALGEQPAVAAAILELFHLLPAQSAKFMETEGEPPCLDVLLVQG